MSSPPAPADPAPPLPEIVMLMAALIASVRTLRFEAREFQGMRSPRFEAAMSESLTVAQALYKRAQQL